MNKRFLLPILLLVLPAMLFAQYRASLIESSGKVEIKAPGSSTWDTATIGDVLEAGTMISTGLKSSAVLLMGNSRLNVKALTRLTLKELSEKQDSVNTELYLTVGKIGADVKPISGKPQTFKVSSPVATASVRGTSFEFDGVTVQVTHGEVAMGNKLGFVVPVAAGEKVVLNTESVVAVIPTVFETLVSEQKVSADVFNTFAREKVPDFVAEVIKANVDNPVTVIDAKTASVFINIELAE